MPKIKDPMTTPVQTPTTTETVRVDQLKLSFGEFVNPRTITGLTKGEIAELADDIQARGLRTKPEVHKLTKDGEVHYVVEDAQRRVLALTKLGVKEVEVSILSEREYTPEVAAEMMMSALGNAMHREGLSSYEQAEAAARLLEGKKDQKTIGQALGRSKTWVSYMLNAWKKSTPELRAQWKAGLFTDEQFKNLADVPAPKQVEAAADITTLREKGDRAAARKVAKEASEKEIGKPVPRKIEVVTWDPKTKKEVVTKVSRAEAEKKGIVRTENAPTATPVPRPPIRMVEEYAKLRKMKMKGPRDSYVRGMLDMAAFVVGELGQAKFEPAWAKFCTSMIPVHAAKTKPEKKAKAAKGSAIVARAKAQKEKRVAGKGKSAPKSMKQTKARARKAKAAKRK
jgi:ParB-like chromosome segregation protein Spo0J